MNFLGIVSDEDISKIYSQIKVPNNAVEFEAIDILDLKFQLLASIPIFIMMFIIVFYKVRKYRNNKDEFLENYKKKINDNKGIKKVLLGYKYIILIGVCIILPAFISIFIHELIHAIFMIGNGVFFGVSATELIGFAMVIEPISKLQLVISALSPIILLGIAPFTIITILFPRRIKSRVIYIIISLCIFSITCTALPDLVSTYNILKNVPNNSKIIYTENNSYWIKDNE